MSDFETRFGGIARLYGQDGLDRLRAAHVAIIGVGGVGSWAVEALARSGVGALTLIDADEVCVSNVNRQLHALDGEFGRAKVEVLAHRMRAINPEVRIKAQQEFFTAESAPTLLAERFDYVFDAIDTLAHKVLLIAACAERKIPIITSGGAGGRRLGASVRIADLAHASHDPLLQKVRKKLRAEHGFPTATKIDFGIPCVFSPDLPIRPDACDITEPGLRMDCNSGYGAITAVTGTFGFIAAGHIVNSIAVRA